MMGAAGATGGVVYGIDATSIAKTGTQTAAAGVLANLPIGTAATTTQVIAFSSTGDMWVGSCRSGQTPQTLAKFAPGKIGTSGSPSQTSQSRCRPRMQLMTALVRSHSTPPATCGSG